MKYLVSNTGDAQNHYRAVLILVLMGSIFPTILLTPPPNTGDVYAIETHHARQQSVVTFSFMGVKQTALLFP